MLFNVRLKCNNITSKKCCNKDVFTYNINLMLIIES